MSPSATDPTSTAAAKENLRQAILWRNIVANNDLEIKYLTAFESWKMNVNAGRISNLNPPAPPPSFTLAFDDQGWAYPLQNGPQVCDMPPIPEDYSQPAPVVIGTGNDQKMNVPPGDTMPVGFILRDSQGGRWQKVASVTPFGTAYYYQRLS